MNRRGSAAVLAMIFLVVFAALSFAFYALVTTSTAVAANDQAAQRARAAAESGMEFGKYLVSRWSVQQRHAASTHLDRFGQYVEDLWSSTEEDSSALRLPTMTAHASQQFNLTIQEDASATPLHFVVSSEGIDARSKLRRTISAHFAPRQVGDGMFGYDAWTNGGALFDSVHIDTATEAGIGVGSQDAVAVNLIGSTVLDGDLAVTVSADQIQASSSAQAGGSTGEEAIQYATEIVDPPLGSDFIPSDFKVFATGGKDGNVYTNYLVDPQHRSFKLAGGDAIEGILYVSAGVNVEINGDVRLRGIIVCEEGASITIVASGNGGLTSEPSTPGVMSDELRAAAAGWSILAPTADISIEGSASVNVTGSIVCNTFTATGSGGGGGGKDVAITNGSLVALSTSNPAINISNRDITFTRDGNYVIPTTGIVYSWQYVMVPDSYLEESNAKQVQ